MGMHIRTSSMLIYMYHEHHQTIFVLDVSEERKKTVSNQIHSGLHVVTHSP